MKFGQPPTLKDKSSASLPEWQLFEEKIHSINGKQKIAGFNSPDGKYYPLEENEQLVHIKSGDGTDRETFIRKDDKDIPFETWKQGK